MRVSVVINTLNRAYFLKRTIEALTLQDYDDFEVIVVNGPSTDNTDEILKLYEGYIKIKKCPVPNLSVSRNIGIKVASGHIVAFIDDDAIPVRTWLTDITNCYKTSSYLGGVGGKVLRLNGDLEFKNGYVNIWGCSQTVNEISPNYNDPKGYNFNYVTGGNAAFLRKGLIEIGGFDEYYEYFHDESDVAVRLIKKGYKIIHHNDVTIYHEAAKGEYRQSGYKKNWYPIVKNQVYFGLKNSEGYEDLNERKKKVKEQAEARRKEFKQWCRLGYISKNELKEFLDIWQKGYDKGLEDGISTKRLLNFDLDNCSEFLKFNKNDIKPKINICLVSFENPLTAKGGVGKYTKELAEGFVNELYPVHIITSGKEETSFLSDGINYHYVKNVNLPIDEIESLPICKKNLAFSYAVYQKIKKLINVYGIKIVEFPLWDYSGVVSANLSEIPVVTRLETPLKMVMDIFEWKDNDDLQLSRDFEINQIKNSQGVIYISDDIKNTIERLYEINIENIADKVYLGLDPNIDFKSSETVNKKTTVFFIGRLERRKGIHNLLNVIPEIVKKYPNLEFRIAGEDSIVDEKVGDSFKNLFFKENKGSKVLESVKFLGKVSDEEKEQEFENCDIFVSPSLYESFGIIFIEAMRHKKPVIGCNVGGMTEVIENNVTGILAEPDDINSLKKALENLIENKQLREDMGLKGYERFLELFTTPSMITNTISHYKRVLNLED